MHLLHGSQHATAPNTDGDTRLLELVVFVLTRLTYASHDRDITTGNGNIAILRQQVAAHDANVAARIDEEIAASATNRAA